MTRTVRRLAGLLTLILALFMATPLLAREDSELVLGRISDSPKDTYVELKPLLDYVVPRMRDVGITSGRILMAKDMSQMLGMVRRGQVDWVTETSGMGSLLHLKGGLVPILATDRSGVSNYYSIIFVRKDSGIRDLKELRGKKIAFQRPSSTSSFLLPADMLRREHLELQNIASPFDAVTPDGVGYIFAQSETNILTWVHKRLVQAGALSNLDLNNSKFSKAFLADFNIIARSAPVPRGLELTSPQMSAAVRERLIQVLEQAERDPKAAPALRSYYRSSGFTRIDAAQRKEITKLGRQMEQLREALE